MSYRLEKNGERAEVVIDGFGDGVADSPHSGMCMIKNVNVTTVPGEASVELETQELTKPPTVSAVSYTTDTSADTVTVSDASSYYNGMAITLNTVVTSTGISTGRVYWVGDLSSNTFKLYTNPSRNASTVVNIGGSDGSGTLSSYTLGKPIDSTIGIASSETYLYQFILDNAGRAWWIDNKDGTATNNLVYMGNDTLTGDEGRGIVCWKNHLIVFRASNVDGVGLAAIEQANDFNSAYGDAATGGWDYGWDSVSSFNLTGVNVREVLVGEDDILYFDNLNRLGSFSENTGSTLDLDNGATFTKNVSALDLPEEEEDALLTIGELGTDLLIGGRTNNVYPWDRISSSFNFPLKFPEHGIQKIVSSNSLTFIFAGYRGRIYVTNGSGVEVFKKVPDHLAGSQNPYFTINSCELTKNQIYFSFTATTNAGGAVSGLDGVWALDISTGSLRLNNTLTHATDGTTTTIQRYALSDTPSGDGLVIGWEDDSSNYGIDIGSSNPYSGGESIIETDIIPIGTNRYPETITQIEYKLSKPLVSGESIQLLQRSNLNDSFTSIGTGNTAGSLSGSFDATFENVEWLQIRAVLTSTDSSPSYVPLREIRIQL